MRMLFKRPRAEIAEIFRSFQGEGVYAGEEQIFARFQGCNMRCVFCDTPQRGLAEKVLIGSMMKRISCLNRDRKVKVISVTGGEPLLQADFLEVFLSRVKRRGYGIHLDTNGTLPDKLSRIIGIIDVVAMDIKLPSSTSDREFWDEHRRFLLIARTKTVFVKIVITPQTAEDELAKAVELIEEIDRMIPLVLQPVSFSASFDKPPDNAVLIRWQRRALKKLPDVRIIPQLHKIWRLR